VDGPTHQYPPQICGRSQRPILTVSHSAGNARYHFQFSICQLSRIILRLVTYARRGHAIRLAHSIAHCRNYGMYVVWLHDALAVLDYMARLVITPRGSSGIHWEIIQWLQGGRAYEVTRAILTAPNMNMNMLGVAEQSKLALL